MVKKKKNKIIIPLWFSIPIFLFSWYVLFIHSFILFNSLIDIIKFPTAFTLFMFPIEVAVWFIILLFTLFFANQINRKLKLKIIKK